MRRVDRLLLKIQQAERLEEAQNAVAEIEEVHSPTGNRYY